MVTDPAVSPRRRIALIAHDNKKRDMVEWAEYNRGLLAGHDLTATTTTGRILRDQVGLPVTCVRSGPFGGDQQIGALPAAARRDGGVTGLIGALPFHDDAAAGRRHRAVAVRTGAGH